MKKTQSMLVWLRKMVLAPHNCARRHGWQMVQQQHCAAAEKSLINMI
jgi:hypothetical protein